jgi:monooxygenase
MNVQTQIRAAEPATTEHFDVLIAGAGISGVGAAYHLTTQCPGTSFVALETQKTFGGTWTTHRYPGIRSDSDLHTFGYRFKPWTSAPIATAAEILKYMGDVIEENDLARHIRYRHTITSAKWSSETNLWTIDATRTDTGELLRFTANFFWMCQGYYRHTEGYTPEWKGMAKFTGPIVHPQKWPEDLDYKDKRVIVIGSGATAATLVPEMARTAGHVTMLQRSPTYVVARPAEDALANKLRQKLSATLAYHLIRWRNVLLGMYFFQLCRRKPDRAKQLILGGVKMALGPEYDVARHFTPRYNPWEQRLCLVPDGDLFKSIRDKRASVVTNAIDTFTKGGIKLQDGSELEADIIVTATGLNLQVLGGLEVSVDGRAVDFARTLNYKGMMYSDIPNMASAFGYTNASWTLKCDLTCEYVCRLINYMDRNGYKQCMPHNVDPDVTELPSLDFSSGYVQRSIAKLPKQGSKRPWRLYQNYALDIVTLRYGKVDDGVMQYS